MPDPVGAKQSIWLPFMKNELLVRAQGGVSQLDSQDPSSFTSIFHPILITRYTSKPPDAHSAAGTR
jgi:hypothetical protein